MHKVLLKNCKILYDFWLHSGGETAEWIMNSELFDLVVVALAKAVKSKFEPKMPKLL